MKKFFIFILSFFIVILSSSCEKSHFKFNEVEEQQLNKYDIVATWINYFEISSLVNASDTQDIFDNKINNIVVRLKEFKINTIFLQVRAFDDAFYKSKISSASIYCLNDDNTLKFDVLETFIRICKDKNIDVHAWINPYRIRNDNNAEKISLNSYAKEIIKKNINDERIIITDNMIYYNPSYIENHNYILNCVREIINNYDVKGIHIDDYFYPTTSENIDKEIYKEYQENGGKLSLSDYRRNCINIFVSSLYQLVSIQNNLIFSISPCGDIEKNFNELYADVEKWIENYGYADYIIPQLYYGFENEKLSYIEIFNIWMSFNNKKKIIIGLPLYKIGNVDIYAGAGENEWIEKENVILNQIKYSEKYDIDGFAFYSSSQLYEEYSNMKIELEIESIRQYINDNW